jgi:DNA-binding NtrC family response regulator
MLCGYAWPGNIRELKNFVKRLIIMRPGQDLGADAIRKELPVDSTTNRRQTFSRILPMPSDATSNVHWRRAMGPSAAPTGAAKLLAVPPLHPAVSPQKIRPEPVRLY